jgi:cysteinyl-tRNA synthetase
MSLRVFDTLRDLREEFRPVQAGKVGMYMCGMTVQDRPHVGHMRGTVVGDMIRRVLTYFDYDVTYLNNFTDVDDKVIERAQQEGVDYTVIARRNMDAYLKYVDLLGNLRATHYPRATQHMPEIQDLIASLIQQGAAYQAEGDVYFRVDRFAGYGKLSKRRIEDLRSGARIEVGELKENPLDFALWKASKEGEPHWDSPWGPGRPGWHIECSAMSMKYLGPHFDIHGGGLDLIFPHHENEIAQAEAATGGTFVNYWVQHGLVLLGGEKMSKSTKHFFLIEDICRITDPATVRFYLLSTHFRSPIEFNEERLQEAGIALSRLRASAKALREAVGPAGSDIGDREAISSVSYPEYRGAVDRFVDALQDDFNSARAIGYLFDLARGLNRVLAQPSSGAKEDLVRQGQRVFHHLGDLLGIDLEPRAEGEAPEAVRRLVDDRAAARDRKEWARADQIRQEILGLGYLVEDKEGKSIVRPVR